MEKKDWKEFKITKMQKLVERFSESIILSPKAIKYIDFIDAKLRHPKREKLPFTKEDVTKLAKDMVAARQDLQKRLDREEEHLRKKWAQEIILLLNYGTVQFGKHDHKGRLRGKNIARAFHTDLKRIGYKTRLSFKGMTGIVKRI